MRVFHALAAVLLASVVLGASDCSGGGGDTIVQQSPQSHPVYESGDLGSLDVLGDFAEARARFTLGADELPLAVIVDGDYVPAFGNPAPAIGELTVADSRADQDPLNDLIVGILTPSPFSRVNFSADTPGSFSIRVPIAAGSPDRVALCGGTWSARFRVNTTSWYGSISGLKVRVVAIKGAEIRPAPLSFVRDQ